MEVMKNIFIVDDDEMLAMAMSDYLTRDEPHAIKVFATGEECLEALTEHPDVIILDYYLNSKLKYAANGLEILKLIREKLPEVRIFMLSSQDSFLNAADAIEEGVNQYVIKDKDAFAKIKELIN